MKKYIMIGILFAFPFCLSADEPIVISVKDAESLKKYFDT